MRFLFQFLFAFVLYSFNGAAFAQPDPPANPPGETDAQKLAAALKREEDLRTENAALKNKKKSKGPPPEDDDDADDAADDDDADDDLNTKARKKKASDEKTAATTKQIEKALGFNLGVDDFVAKNSSLLPSEIVSIVKLAHKETYDSAFAKASALKAAIIQAYFTVQSNVDALTAGQKTTLDDYLKLTKTGKETKAAEIYENIFEPALETIRQVKKAEELSRGRTGLANSSEGDSNYKDKLVRMSRKTHLGQTEA